MEGYSCVPKKVEDMFKDIGIDPETGNEKS